MEIIILEFIKGLLITLEVVLPIYTFYVIFSVAKKYKYLAVGFFGMLLFIMLKTKIYEPIYDSYSYHISWGLANVVMWSSILVYLQRTLKDKKIKSPNIKNLLKKIKNVLHRIITHIFG